MRVAEEIFVKKNKNTIIKNVFPAVWKDIITNPPQEILDVICDKIEKACGYRPDDATVARFLLRGCPACFLILKGVVISSHETNRFS
ncbi:hypothetical protein [Desulfovibrio sp.]|uniref:hypothetical protein n=1 Tax=Desulfovibrio sp. TaxID=885 RepID=UPI002A91232F|nr:hypothetical protein [Desulfovibrio sp.]